MNHCATNNCDGNDAAVARNQPAASIMSAAFSAIIMVGALVLPPISVGMTEASTTRSPSRPRTFSVGSTTAWASVPILQVPTGWKMVNEARSRT